MLNSGELIAGRYQLDGPIAAGGMGDVWRATDIALKRPVAVKVLRTHLAADPTFSARFRIEARSIAALHHPGVVSVYDYGESRQDGALDMAYLVMALIDGDPLSARIKAAGQLPPPQAMAIVAQAARALEAAHNAGIIHRDVKPDNLLIDTEGRVVLVDFGVAQAAFAETLTAAGQVVGTARYMAPEQISKRPLSPATDIYALGAVAYHCLAGHPPFTGDNAISVALNHLHDDPEPLPETIPALVRAVVMRAMAKDPQHRYASAAAMASAAEAAVRDRLVDTSPETEIIPPAQPSGNGPIGVATAAIPPPAEGTEAMPIPAAVAPVVRSRRRAVFAAVALLVLLAGGGLLLAAFSTGNGGSGGGLEVTTVTPNQTQTNHPKPSSSSGSSSGSGSGSGSGHGPSGKPSPSPSASPPDSGTPSSGPTTEPGSPGPTDSETSGDGSGGGSGSGGGGTPSADPPSADPSSSS